MSDWLGEHALVLLVGAAVFGVDEEQRRRGVMADDFRNRRKRLKDKHTSVTAGWSEWF